MKTILIFLFSVSFFQSISQTIKVDVRNVQTFSHSIKYETNDAINKNVIIYGESGITKTTYFFDLTSKVLYRNMDNYPKEQYEIVSYNKKSKTYNVLVKFNNETLLNYTIAKLDNKNIIRCRYYKEGEVLGWFDDTVIINEN